LSIALIASAGSSASALHSSAQDALSRERAAETFQVAWEQMRDSGALTDVDEATWADLRSRYEDRAGSATSNAELRGVLEEMIEELGKSHFAIIPGEIRQAQEGGAPAGDATTGIDARFVGDSAIVVAVTPDSPAHAAGVLPGWRIESIRELDMQDYARGFGEVASASMSGYHRNSALKGMLSGQEGSTIPVVMHDLDGDRHELELETVDTGSELIVFGNLPPMPVSSDHRVLDSKALEVLGIEVDGDYKAGLLTFNVWMVPIMQPIARAIESFREADVDCIIIDLRGNPGGVGGLAMGVGGHFLDEPTSLGTMTNDYGELHFNTNPQRISASGELVEPTDVPLFILTDEMSASTSEIFAGGMQEAGRATVVGRRTPGLALPAIASDLPNGDIFYHAVASFELPSGTLVEGVGISPDIPVDLDATTFRRSADPDIRAAVECSTRKKHATEATD